MEEIDEKGTSGSIMSVDWVDIEIEVALDSGCCEHVMDTEICAPGYEVHEWKAANVARDVSWEMGPEFPTRERCT